LFTVVYGIDIAAGIGTYQVGKVRRRAAIGNVFDLGVFELAALDFRFGGLARQPAQYSVTEIIAVFADDDRGGNALTRGRTDECAVRGVDDIKRAAGRRMSYCCWTRSGSGC
jgi:hypothetical protein